MKTTVLTLHEPAQHMAVHHGGVAQRYETMVMYLSLITFLAMASILLLILSL